MRFSDGTLKNFKEIMNEVFYDWGMTSNPQIHQEDNGNYWINKTYLFEEEGKFYLNYKTTTFEIDAKAYKKFQVFYEMYKDDQEFEKVLGFIENYYNEKDFAQTDKGVSVGSLSFEAENMKYWVQDTNLKEEISKMTFQKIKTFYTLLNSN